MSNTNLISNVGFGADSTHYKHQTVFNSTKISEIKFPLDHPSIMCRNVAADDYIEKLMYTGGIKARIKRKIISYIPKKIYFFFKAYISTFKNT